MQEPEPMSDTVSLPILNESTTVAVSEPAPDPVPVPPKSYERELALVREARAKWTQVRGDYDGTLNASGSLVRLVAELEGAGAPLAHAIAKVGARVLGFAIGAAGDSEPMIRTCPTLAKLPAPGESPVASAARALVSDLVEKVASRVDDRALDDGTARAASVALFWRSAKLATALAGRTPTFSSFHERKRFESECSFLADLVREHGLDGELQLLHEILVFVSDAAGVAYLI